MRWEFRTPTPLWSGVLSTAGGLVFGGAGEGNVFALDAADGKPLWQFQTGGAIRTNPMSYEVDGRQFILTAGGSGFFAFALPPE